MTIQSIITLLTEVLKFSAFGLQVEQNKVKLSPQNERQMKIHRSNSLFKKAAIYTKHKLHSH